MEGLAKYLNVVERTDPIKYVGRVTKVLGLLVESHGPQAVIGEICQILAPRLGRAAYAEVVGLREDAVQLMSYEGLEGIEVGCQVIATGDLLQVPVSARLLGRVLDSMGRPQDGKGDVSSETFYPAVARPPDALTKKAHNATGRHRHQIHRRPHTARPGTAHRHLRGLGRGQVHGYGHDREEHGRGCQRHRPHRGAWPRGAGVHRERPWRGRPQPLGRHRIDLGHSASLETPRRLRRGSCRRVLPRPRQGRDAPLRLRHALRTGAARGRSAIGEPPATRGYTPSVFDSMPKLLERSGTSDKGSITGVYTILVDGDDMDEPIADTVRGILDGHIVLSRGLAQRYQYPAVDVLKSVSRLVGSVTGPITQKVMGYVRKVMAVYEENEDMITIGAYVKGSNPAVDEAIAKREAVQDFLIQAVEEKAPIADTIRRLSAIAGISVPPQELSAYAAEAKGLPRGACRAAASRR